MKWWDWMPWFIFGMLNFKPAFSLSTFILIMRLFSSLLSAIWVVSSAYLRLLIFLPENLIRASASSSWAFHMMYSAYKLNKQGSLKRHEPQHARPLSITNSWSSPKLMSIELVMPSNHLTLCRPLLLLPSIFPSIRIFQMNQLFASGGQSTGVSASTSVLPMNTQDWSPLGWTGWISLQSKRL